MSQFLDGVRVFDLSIVTAGAGCTQVLGDFGAQVIKVESANRPDLFRRWAGHEKDQTDDLDSPPFRTVNRNKLGFGVNLKNPRGLEVARMLISQCDVVVENFRQGVMDRLGLGFEELVRLRPNVVLVSVASQGTDGPNVGYGSYGSTLDALGGTMSVTGYDASTPLWSSNKVNYPDQTASLLGPGLIVLAILAARSTGKPQWVDISQREIVTALLPEQILRVSLGARDPVPTGNGAATDGDGTDKDWLIRCLGEDEWIAVTLCSAGNRAALLRAMALPADAGTSDNNLQAAVAEWCSGRSKHAVMTILQGHGIAAAAVTKGPELHSDPYFEFIDYFRSVDLPHPGTEKQRGRIVRFDDADATVKADRRAPHVGEHTIEVMTNVLGATPDVVDELLVCGALSQSAAV